MKNLLSMLAVSTLVGTSASNLKPVFTSNVVNHDFKSNQLNRDISIKNQNNTNPFINKIPTIDDNSNISSNVISSNGHELVKFTLIIFNLDSMISLK